MQQKDYFLNHVFGTIKYSAKRIKDIVIPMFSSGTKRRQEQYRSITGYLSDPTLDPRDALNAAFYVFQQVLEDYHELEVITGPIAFYCPVRFVST